MKKFNLMFAKRDPRNLEKKFMLNIFVQRAIGSPKGIKIQTVNNAYAHKNVSSKASKQ